MISEDVARVPHGDAPESWGVDIVRQIRERQRRQRQPRVARAARAVEPAVELHDAMAAEEEAGRCRVM